MWWHNWRYLPHMKDEALCPAGFLVEALPIAPPDEKTLQETLRVCDVLLRLTRADQGDSLQISDWLAIQFGIDEPSAKLRNPLVLTGDVFVKEVQRSRGKSKPLTAAGLNLLREEYARTIEPARARAAEAAALENRLSDLVNAAYGLTPEEIQLMWDTAPPRMPIPRPPHLPPALS